MVKPNKLVPESVELPTLYATWVEASAIRKDFLDHLRSTNEPETFPGLSHTKPPAGAPFVLIVKDFTVDVRKRPGGEMIPCAACQTDKKFGMGCLAYYPEEQVLRVIGNNCGDVRRSEANSEYKERTERAATSEYLLQTLPHVDGHLKRVQALQPVAAHAEALSNQVRRKAKTFCKIVMTEAKQGGDVLTKYVFAEDADGRDASHRVPVHKLAGSGFLRTSFQPATKLSLAAARLRACHFGDEESSLEWLVDHSEDHDELRKLAIVLRSALGGIEEVLSLLSVARAFLAAENMRGIDRWAYDAGHHEVRAQWSTSQIWVKGPSQHSRSFSTSIKPDYPLLESGR